MQFISRRALALGVAGVAVSLTVLPATAESDSKGTETVTTPAAQTAVVKPAKRVRTKLGVMSARRHILAGRRTTVRGKLFRGGAGRVVQLQVRRGKRGWTTIGRAKTRAKGRYTVRGTVRRLGSYRLRVRFAGDKAARGSRRTIGTMNVYRKVFASWYSIGGGTVACPGGTRGARYTVAHKSLPCGTKVTFRYRGRTVRATVVDRGPFVGNREYDLEAATKRALGAGDLTTLMSNR